MNDALKRQKAMAILRDMDTDNLVELLGMAPQQMVPRPAMDELQKMLVQEIEQEDQITPDDFFYGFPDPNIKEADRSPRFQVIKGSQVAHDLAAFLGEKTEPVERTRLRLVGPGKLTAAKPDIDMSTPEVEYLGKLYENAGDEPENNSDDANWL
jgi:hypothetical protein